MEQAANARTIRETIESMLAIQRARDAQSYRIAPTVPNWYSHNGSDSAGIRELSKLLSNYFGYVSDIIDTFNGRVYLRPDLAKEARVNDPVLALPGGLYPAPYNCNYISLIDDLGITVRSIVDIALLGMLYFFVHGSNESMVCFGEAAVRRTDVACLVAIHGRVFEVLFEPSHYFSVIIGEHMWDAIGFRDFAVSIDDHVPEIVDIEEAGGGGEYWTNFVIWKPSGVLSANVGSSFMHFLNETGAYRRTGKDVKENPGPRRSQYDRPLLEWFLSPGFSSYPKSRISMFDWPDGSESSAYMHADGQYHRVCKCPLMAWSSTVISLSPSLAHRIGLVGVNLPEAVMLRDVESREILNSHVGLKFQSEDVISYPVERHTFPTLADLCEWALAAMTSCAPSNSLGGMQYFGRNFIRVKSMSSNGLGCTFIPNRNLLIEAGNLRQSEFSAQMFIIESTLCLHLSLVTPIRGL